ncbi:hypothetical protein L5515_018804 [Caenorhabditis briggsae]|uniref:Uncharacterized protein n=1 Tax=Caenorhabditis briggsae TaxID=6238 RepID=A0AAE9JUQ0_CAEBR|nr:hypothetical protein L5515_018804 [Caenorhabditis briggsae]
MHNLKIICLTHRCGIRDKQRHPKEENHQRELERNDRLKMDNRRLFSKRLHKICPPASLFATSHTENPTVSATSTPGNFLSWGVSSGRVSLFDGSTGTSLSEAELQVSPHLGLVSALFVEIIGESDVEIDVATFVASGSLIVEN